MTTPASVEVAACMGRFFTGGIGPRHTDISAVFGQFGFDDVDPYDPVEGTPNKETRVRVVIGAAVGRPRRARPLIEGLLAEMRAHGSFERSSSAYDELSVQSLRQALLRTGWELTDGGTLGPVGIIDVQTGGRQAIDDQLGRLHRATDDPALLLGTAKDLLEAVAQSVLEELEFPYRAKADYAELWYLARERLGIHPRDIDVSVPGGPHVRQILQSAWAIADSVNALRASHGTGHGRTLLPSGVSAEMALLVVREACKHGRVHASDP